MKKFLIISFVLLLSFNLSFAQSSNTYRSTLKTMLEVAGTEATFKTAIKQMFVMIKQQKSNVPANVWTELEKEFSSVSLNDLLDMFTPVYQKYLTEADLLKIIEFYQTPTGKKFAEKTPFLTQESMQVGQEWGRKIGQQLTEKLKAKGY